MSLAQTVEIAVLFKGQNMLSGPTRAAAADIGLLNSGLVKTVGSEAGTGGIIGGVTKGFGVVGRAATGLGDAATHAKQFLGGMLSSVGALAGPVGMLGLAGAISYTAKSAIDFQQSMKMIETQAGASATEVKTMSADLLQMAASVGTGPNELAQGLFHLESAGFRGATALNALKIAAEGAKIGGANLEDVTNALDAVLVAGGKDAQDMGGAMGQLNAIVGSGDMHMQDLADAMGTGILAVARTFGVSLKDVGAALATFGDNNIRGADAATKLRQALITMGAPSSAAAKQLKAIGISSTQLGDDLRNKGLVFALTDLKTHLEAAGLTATQQAEVISHAFGGGRTGVAIMLLLSQLERVKSKEQEIGAAGSQFANDWAMQQQTAAQKFADFGAAIDAVSVSIGNAILPTLTDFAQGVATWISSNQTAIVGFVKRVVVVIREIGNVISTTILPAIKTFGSAVKGVWDSIPGPLRTLLVEALIGNKVIKTVFGINIIGSIEGAIGGKIAGALGGLFSKGGSPLNPMFVKDVGGLPGGGPTSALGGLGAKTIGGVALSTIAVAAAAVLATAIAVKLAFDFKNQSDEIRKQGQALVTTTQQFAGDSGTSAQQLQAGIDAINTQEGDGLNKVALAITNPFNHGQDTLDATKAILQARLDALLTQGDHTDKSLYATQGNTAILPAMQASVGRLNASEHADAAKQEAQLAKDFSMIAGITVAQKNAITGDLQLQLIAAKLHHKETYAALLTASHTAHLDHLSRMAAEAKLFGNAQKILASSETTKQKIIDLKAIQAKFSAIGDTASAKKIAGDIATLLPPLDTIAGRIGALMTLQSTKDQGSSPTAKVPVVSVTTAQNTAKHYGPTPSHSPGPVRA